MTAGAPAIIDEMMSVIHNLKSQQGVLRNANMLRAFGQTEGESQDQGVNKEVRQAKDKQKDKQKGPLTLKPAERMISSSESSKRTDDDEVTAGARGCNSHRTKVQPRYAALPCGRGGQRGQVRQEATYRVRCRKRNRIKGEQRQGVRAPSMRDTNKDRDASAKKSILAMWQARCRCGRGKQPRFGHRRHTGY